MWHKLEDLSFDSQQPGRSQGRPGWGGGGLCYQVTTVLGSIDRWVLETSQTA